jgi:hypothetical protein
VGEMYGDWGVGKLGGSSGGGVGGEFPSTSPRLFIISGFGAYIELTSAIIFS